MNIRHTFRRIALFGVTLFSVMHMAHAAFPTNTYTKTLTFSNLRSDENFKDFRANMTGFEDLAVTFTYDSSIAGYYGLVKVKESGGTNVYYIANTDDVTVSGSTLSYMISHTNAIPNGTHNMEVLIMDSTSTNVVRSGGRGTLNVRNSLFDDEDGTWSSPAGSAFAMNYLLRSGTLPMTGNLNMGANTITNGTWGGSEIADAYIPAAITRDSELAATSTADRAYAAALVDDLSGVTDAATARTNLGLVAGGAGDIWVEKAGDTMTGDLNMGGNSITNIATNSLAFTDGTRLSVVSSGVVGVASSPAGTVYALAQQSAVDTVSANVTANDTDITDLYTRDGQQQREIGVLDLKLISADYNMAGKIVAAWDTTNNVAVQSNATYDAGGDYFYSESPVSVDLSGNVVSQHPLDDNAASTDVTDTGGSNFTGVASGNTSTLSESGKLGTSFYFDGSEYVTIANATIDYDFNSAFSIEFWAKFPTTGSTYDFFGSREASGDYQGVIFSVWTHTDGNTPGAVGFGLDVGGSSPLLRSSGNYRDNAWHHIVGVFENLDAVLYIDGSEAALFSDSFPAASATADANVDFTFGGIYPATANFVGWLDHVTVYNRALTLGEVTARYNSGTGTTNVTIVSGGDMELQSTTYNSALTYTECVALLDLTNSVSPTNVLASVSQDNGSTWDDLTIDALVLQGGDGGYIWAYTNANLLSTGTQIVYRIQVTNDAAERIYNGNFMFD